MKNKIAIICGEFHKAHIEVMLNEAKSVAKDCNLEVVREIWVPGSYEVPLILQQILSDAAINGAVVLGLIERGETKHGLVMGQAVMPAIVNLELRFNKPVGIGILGPEILPEQIEKRLKPHAKAAVIAVKKMLDLLT
ncbi:MAG: 6,7-dimethyl-8-ribityllumazine synthase [Candidatus Daviesbacteria bacterium]|nr:6,7-dimethyl-8-ribityllumazine synthase [Candidatus Daviesbacteria bacterium]